jgi:hypothetical protein
MVIIHQLLYQLNLTNYLVCVLIEASNQIHSTSCSRVHHNQLLLGMVMLNDKQEFTNTIQTLMHAYKECHHNLQQSKRWMQQVIL